MNRGEYRKHAVDRYENIVGSGRTHERYFPPAVSFLRRKVQFDVMLDLGCGDGRFLEFVLRGVPGVKVLGIDLSEVSVETTLKNLQKKFKDREIETFAGDAGDIQKWSKLIKAHIGGKRLAISMWFLVHEISRRNPANVIAFLKETHRLFPAAPIVICELVRQSAALLTEHRRHLLMPEYLLFHDISLQGVLSWQEYRHILSSIPYDLAMERVFDEIPTREGSKEPATFVWCLTPKGK